MWTKGFEDVARQWTKASSFSPEIEAGIGTTRDVEASGILEWEQLEVRSIRRDSFRSSEDQNKVGKGDFKRAQF